MLKLWRYGIGISVPFNRIRYQNFRKAIGITLNSIMVLRYPRRLAFCLGGGLIYLSILKTHFLLLGTHFMDGFSAKNLQLCRTVNGSGCAKFRYKCWNTYGYFG